MLNRTIKTYDLSTTIHEPMDIIYEHTQGEEFSIVPEGIGTSQYLQVQRD